jgi:glycosyltransferase 2 family protein
MKLAAKWIISILIGVFFIWLASKEWPLDKVISCSPEFQGASISCVAEAGANEGWTLHYLWLFPAFLVLTLVHFARVLRWKPLLKPLADHDIWTLNRVCAISFMILFLMPLRLGELARPYLLAGEGKVRKSAAFGTIAVERVMDGVMMAFLLFVVLMTLPVEGDTSAYYSLRGGSMIALAVFVSALGILIIAHKNKALAVRIVKGILGPISSKLADKISGMVERFIDGLNALPTPGHVFKSILWTVVYWGLNGFFYWFLAIAFELDGLVTLTVAYGMMASTAVGMMIPNSPGNIGSFWYFLLLPMYVIGVPDNSVQPIVFALTVWLMILLQYFTFSGYFILSGQVNLRKTWETQRRLSQEHD